VDGAIIYWLLTDTLMARGRGPGVENIGKDDIRVEHVVSTEEWRYDWQSLSPKKSTPAA